MIINKNAWHYKVVCNTFCFMDGWGASNSLCLYFWQVVFRLLIALWMGLLCASPLVSLMTALWEVHTWWGALLSIMGYVVIACVLFVLASNLCVYIDEKYKAKRGFRWADEPNILWEYIKAKKAKVCPVLTFETKE